ncbi:MAG: transcription elongation factor GreB [Sterolibacterium sp.]|jgi:transcription elongation factor GreB|nr:transcription elongation factor GreB [Sterolibacterium sp.]
MNKAFVREAAGEAAEDDDVPVGAPSLPAGAANYVTKAGYQRLREEFEQLVKVDRPALVQVVSWAAGNGDRSENGDYIYGKKRLREIDRRIRYLTKRLETAVVVDPQEQENLTQVFFGATVTIMEYAEGGATDEQRATYQIVGVDEADAGVGRISWISPLARALMKAREGDLVRFQSPAGWREIEIGEIIYR